MIYWYTNNFYKISSIVIDEYGTYFIYFFINMVNSSFLLLITMVYVYTYIFKILSD
jgi:hypothetical protein